VLASAALVSLLSGLFFGVIPALSATRTELSSVLKESAAAAAPGGSQRRVRSALAVAQLAIAQALLLCTGLSIHALVEQLRAPLGFEPKNVVVGAVLASTRRYMDPAQVSAFYDRVIETFSALPYVQSAAINNSAPPHDFEAISFEIEGQTTGRKPMFEQHDRISPGYFRTLAIPLLSGRDFGAADAKGGPPVLIVSRSAERRFFGGQALGKRVRLDDEEQAREIVGVVGDVGEDLAVEVFGVGEAAGAVVVERELEGLGEGHGLGHGRPLRTRLAPRASAEVVELEGDFEGVCP